MPLLRQGQGKEKYSQVHTKLIQTAMKTKPQNTIAQALLPCRQTTGPGSTSFPDVPPPQAPDPGLQKEQTCSRRGCAQLPKSVYTVCLRQRTGQGWLVHPPYSADVTYQGFIGSLPLVLAPHPQSLKICNRIEPSLLAFN